ELACVPDFRRTCQPGDFADWRAAGRSGADRTVVPVPDPVICTGRRANADARPGARPSVDADSSGGGHHRAACTCVHVQLRLATPPAPCVSVPAQHGLSAAPGMPTIYG